MVWFQVQLCLGFGCLQALLNTAPGESAGKWHLILSLLLCLWLGAHAVRRSWSATPPLPGQWPYEGSWSWHPVSIKVDRSLIFNQIVYFTGLFACKIHSSGRIEVERVEMEEEKGIKGEECYAGAEWEGSRRQESQEGPWVPPVLADSRQEAETALCVWGGAAERREIRTCNGHVYTCLCILIYVYVRGGQRPVSGSSVHLTFWDRIWSSSMWLDKVPKTFLSPLLSFGVISRHQFLVPSQGPGIWIQALVFTEQIFTPLSHLPSHLFLLIKHRAEVS